MKMHHQMGILSFKLNSIYYIKNPEVEMSVTRRQFSSLMEFCKNKNAERNKNIIKSTLSILNNCP